MNQSDGNIGGLLRLTGIGVPVLIASLTGCDGDVPDQTPKERLDSFGIHKQVAEQAGSNGSLPKNLYFGDLHVHTALSGDAYLWGNRNSLDAAYRFARGEPITLASGEEVQISPPLDFAAITDHASSFDMAEFCWTGDPLAEDRVRCEDLDTPSNELFELFMRQMRKRPVDRFLGFCDDDEDRCQRAANRTWQRMQQAAEEHYSPGEFTTFSAYEFSPALSRGLAKIHVKSSGLRKT